MRCSVYIHAALGGGHFRTLALDCVALYDQRKKVDNKRAYFEGVGHLVMYPLGCEYENILASPQ